MNGCHWKSQLDVVRGFSLLILLPAAARVSTYTSQNEGHKDAFESSKLIFCMHGNFKPEN